MRLGKVGLFGKLKQHFKEKETETPHKCVERMACEGVETVIIHNSFEKLCCEEEQKRNNYRRGVLENIFIGNVDNKMMS